MCTAQVADNYNNRKLLNHQPTSLASNVSCADVVAPAEKKQVLFSIAIGNVAFMRECLANTNAWLGKR